MEENLQPILEDDWLSLGIYVKRLRSCGICHLLVQITFKSCALTVRRKLINQSILLVASYYGNL